MGRSVSTAGEAAGGWEKTTLPWSEGGVEVCHIPWLWVECPSVRVSPYSYFHSGVYMGRNISHRGRVRDTWTLEIYMYLPLYIY
jgi:hypothetical protein